MDHKHNADVLIIGAAIYFSHRITDYQENNTGVSLKGLNQEAEEYLARGRFVLDASGYGRVLPRLLNLDKPYPFCNRG